MALKDLSSGRTDVYKIDPRIIQIKEGWNSRDMSDPANQAHIDELSKSIAEVGVKRPLTVVMEGNVPFLTDGECRLRATLLAIKNGADIKTVPVTGEDRYANEADRIFSQILLNSGKPLTGIEQAKVFKRLLDLGWKQNEIASKAGISGGRVSQLLELLTLPVVLQKFITEGKASASMVLSTFKKHNGDVALTVAELSGAVAVAEKQGRTRAMPKDTEEGGEGTSGHAKPAKSQAIKALLKEIIEQASADDRIDDTENMVTISMPDDQYRSILNILNI
jgi:ParB/RepB/Spo0J family partition protein